MLRELHDVIQGDGDPARKMELAERILAMDDTAHALGPEKREFVLVVQGQSLGQLALQRGDEEARALLERAMVCFDAALGVLTLQAYPAFRATALQYKAEALSVQAEKLEGAPQRQALAEVIACYDQLLQIHQRGTAPLEWASAQQSKGEMLEMLARGSEGSERKQLLRDAIGCLTRHCKCAGRRWPHPNGY